MSEQLLTFDDWLDLPEDEGRLYELLDGRLVPRYGYEDGAMVTGPAFRHQVIVMRLGALIWTWIRSGGPGVVLTDFSQYIDDHNGLRPDLVWLAEAPDEPNPAYKTIPAPAIIVEVLSPSTKRYDTMTKCELYARSGVREYWIVDSELERVERYVAPFGKPELLMAPDVLTSALLPGFEVTLEALFDPSSQ